MGLRPRDDYRRSEQRQRSVARDEALAWARRMGFTEAQAPWAALTALSLRVGRKGAPVYAKDVRERLEVTVPHLFIDRAQLGLFGDEAL